MQRHLDQELSDHRNLVLTMAGYASRAAAQAIKSILERNDALAQNVIDDDCILDRHEIVVDEHTIQLLALQGPLASDLRQVVTIMKVAHNLERVGDEATKIARRALELNQLPPLRKTIDLPQMAGAVLAMLTDTLEAFVQGNLEMAREIIGRDKAIDAMNREKHRELLEDMLVESTHITRCLHLMVVCKCLERIADHAKNIAEELIYQVEARDVRHPAQNQVIVPFAPPSGAPPV